MVSPGRRGRKCLGEGTTHRRGSRFESFPVFDYPITNYPITRFLERRDGRERHLPSVASRLSLPRKEELGIALGDELFVGDF